MPDEAEKKIGICPKCGKEHELKYPHYEMWCCGVVYGMVK